MAVAVGTAYEPSDLSKVLMVEQRSFGYLTQKSEKRYIETRHLMSCIGVYLRDDSGTGVLAHIDRGVGGAFSSDQASQAREMMSRLKSGGAVGRICEAYVIKTHLVPGKEFEDVRRALEEKAGVLPEVLDSNDMTAHFLADKDGNLSWLENCSVRYEDTPYALIKRIGQDPRMVCVNDSLQKR